VARLQHASTKQVFCKKSQQTARIDPAIISGGGAAIMGEHAQLLFVLAAGLIVIGLVYLVTRG
jgi:hypothetical protein